MDNKDKFYRATMLTGECYTLVGIFVNGVLHSESGPLFESYLRPLIPKAILSILPESDQENIRTMMLKGKFDDIIATYPDIVIRENGNKYLTLAPLYTTPIEKSAGNSIHFYVSDSGWYQTSERIDIVTFSTLSRKSFVKYYTAEDLEDFGHYVEDSGWFFTDEAILYLCENGFKVFISDIEVINGDIELTKKQLKNKKEIERKEQEQIAMKARAIVSEYHRLFSHKKGDDIPEKVESIEGIRVKYEGGFNIYGSGIEFIIENNLSTLWHLQNNSMDGDNWSASNYMGTIATRYPYNGEYKNFISSIEPDINEKITKTSATEAYALQQIESGEWIQIDRSDYHYFGLFSDSPKEAVIQDMISDQSYFNKYKHKAYIKRESINNFAAALWQWITGINPVYAARYVLSITDPVTLSIRDSIGIDTLYATAINEENGLWLLDSYSIYIKELDNIGRVVKENVTRVPYNAKVDFTKEYYGENYSVCVAEYITESGDAYIQIYHRNFHPATGNYIHINKFTEEFIQDLSSRTKAKKFAACYEKELLTIQTSFRDGQVIGIAMPSSDYIGSIDEVYTKVEGEIIRSIGWTIEINLYSFLAILSDKSTQTRYKLVVEGGGMSGGEGDSFEDVFFYKNIKNAKKHIKHLMNQ